MLAVNQIYNRDCLEGMKEIESGSVDLILADLPYQITQNSWDSIIPLPALWEQYRRVIKPNGAIVLTAAQPFTSILLLSNPRMFKVEWIWRKSRRTGFLNAKKQPLRIHESVLVFYGKQPTYNPQWTAGKPYTCFNTSTHSNKGNYGDYPEYTTTSDGRRYPVTILEFANEVKTVHPTQKPVSLFEYFIRTYSNEGELVLDSCVGGGTTAIAALRTNRRFIGFELNEDYFQVAQARIAAEKEREPNLLTEAQE